MIRNAPELGTTWAQNSVTPRVSSHGAHSLGLHRLVGCDGPAALLAGCSACSDESHYRKQGKPSHESVCPRALLSFPVSVKKSGILTVQDRHLRYGFAVVKPVADSRRIGIANICIGV